MHSCEKKRKLGGNCEPSGVHRKEKEKRMPPRPAAPVVLGQKKTVGLSEGPRARRRLGKAPSLVLVLSSF